MLGRPWLRALIFAGFALGFAALLFSPPVDRDGAVISAGERAIQLMLLALVVILVLRIDRARQRKAAQKALAVDDEPADDSDDDGDDDRS